MIVVANVKIMHIMYTLIVLPDLYPYFPSRNISARHAASADQLSMLPASLVGVDLSNAANGSTRLNLGATTCGCAGLTIWAVICGVDSYSS